MYQNRDEIRTIYRTVWHKMQAGQPLEPMEAIISDTIRMHPEYHELLDSGEAAIEAEFSPESGQTNPFLHMGMHIALREQAGANRPAGFASIYKKLLKKMDPHQAEHAMMECLGQSLWQAQVNNTAPDERAYLDCLKKI